jgi:protein-S-isoprenylcysteine O-methyltransferase Ste14
MRIAPYPAIILACWAVFIAYWVIAGRGTKRTVGDVWRGMGIRAVILLTGFVLLRDQLRDVLRGSANPAHPIVGVAVCVGGLAFAIWARVHLGRNWGMPRAVKENPDLVTSGPYALVRHPIYTGMLVALIGSASVVGWSWLLLPAMLGAYFIYSALVEERLMLHTFPDSYPAYRSRTKMLVPFVI